MEYSAFGHQQRKDSNVSTGGGTSEINVDLSDTEHCILCYNNLFLFSIGKCGHKNVCNTCALRLRFIIKDLQCPICKTEL
jgi:hypothetical protein